ncbi:MAG: hypothetical protein WC549_02135 [Actinomycetota bacterium]
MGKKGKLFFMVYIIISFFIVYTALSQERKKISYAQYTSTPEFLAKKVTGLVIHYEYNADSTNIKMVIDSLYITGEK